MKSISEVAKFFGVCERTVRRWIADGDLKCLHIGSVYRFSEQHIQSFIKRNGTR
jgi:excisionase family DNA binding protein